MKGNKGGGPRTHRTSTAEEPRTTARASRESNASRETTRETHAARRSVTTFLARVHLARKCRHRRQRENGRIRILDRQPGSKTTPELKVNTIKHDKLKEDTSHDQMIFFERFISVGARMRAANSRLESSPSSSSPIVSKSSHFQLRESPSPHTHSLRQGLSARNVPAFQRAIPKKQIPMSLSPVLCRRRCR